MLYTERDNGEDDDAGRHEFVTFLHSENAGEKHGADIELIYTCRRV